MDLISLLRQAAVKADANPESTHQQPVPRPPTEEPAHRVSTMPTPDELRDRRHHIDSLPRAPLARGVEITQVDLGGVGCIACNPPAAICTILHFHGGGYRLGSAARALPLATRLAAATSARVITVDYRLAPEHPFPAAVHDASAVYDAVRHGEQPVLTAGESAGGGVAAALSVACWRSHTPGPTALILMSPWLDLRCVADSYRSRAVTDQLFSLDAAREAAEMYLQGYPADDELASPLLAPEAAFPTSFVTASSSEVLIDESLAFADRLEQFGTVVVRSFNPDLPHAWPSVLPESAASSATLNEIAAFVRSL